ncbi:MAG: hypothetical protein QNJ47_12450 [Nostocaceae cyanobacterium]|nr:hypothetical protein [Nostocaceae cyanobacterium]
MLFTFPPAIQAGIEAGKYVVVVSQKGNLLGIARERLTGRIVGHAVGVTVQNQVDWIRSLPPSELQLLNSADFSTPEFNEIPDNNQETTTLAAPPEQLLYEDYREKSHFSSLRDQLTLMFKTAVRKDYEDYVNQQAGIAGYKTLVPKNLQQASDLTVANLYYYFKIRDESEDKEAVAI